MQSGIIRESLLSKAGRGLRRRYKSLELRLRRRLGSPVVTSSYGARFVANYADATFWFYIKASYGFFYWRRLSAVSQPFIFLDIGANQGLYTICAGWNRHCQRAYAFEPVPTSADLLAQNLALNGVQATCEVVRKAVSASSGPVEIVIHAAHSGAASIAQGNVGGQDVRREWIQTIDAAGLDQIVKAGDLPVYVKIDVEGHEEAVIGELLKCSFAGQIREMFYEVDLRWVKPEALQNMVQQAGFTTAKIGRRKHYDVLATRV
jgi:FkbM family methyltransferase